MLGNSLSRRALDAAVATVQELGREQPDTMVHGDLHYGNIVKAQREPWLAVDPKGATDRLAVSGAHYGHKVGEPAAIVRAYEQVAEVLAG